MRYAELTGDHPFHVAADEVARRWNEEGAHAGDDDNGLRLVDLGDVEPQVRPGILE